MRAAQMLEADFKRQGAVLFQSQVDRVVDRRKLDVKEILSVYAYLTQNRVPIKDDTDLVDNDPVDEEKPVERGARSRLDSWQLKHQLLTATEERELGRQVVLGRQARESAPSIDALDPASMPAERCRSSPARTSARWARYVPDCSSTGASTPRAN